MRILEAGHYYVAKGPTIWSLRGWEVLSKLRQSDDKTLLFIDDVHNIDDVVDEERYLSTENFNPEADFTILESAVVSETDLIMAALRLLPNGKGPKRNGEGRLFVSGVPLFTPSGFPSCVLLDAGLTWRKRALGFDEGVNILPCFYEMQQKNLLRVVRKAIPNFRLRVILFDLAGNFWDMPTGT